MMLLQDKACIMSLWFCCVSPSPSLHKFVYTNIVHMCEKNTYAKPPTCPEVHVKKEGEVCFDRSLSLFFAPISTTCRQRDAESSREPASEASMPFLWLKDLILANQTVPRSDRQRESHHRCWYPLFYMNLSPEDLISIHFLRRLPAIHVHFITISTTMGREEGAWPGNVVGARG